MIVTVDGLWMIVQFWLIVKTNESTAIIITYTYLEDDYNKHNKHQLMRQQEAAGGSIQEGSSAIPSRCHLSYVLRLALLPSYLFTVCFL